MSRWFGPRTLAVVGIMLGLLTGPGSGCTDCPDTTPDDAYTFHTALGEHWIVESGRVEVSATELRITYQTDDGSSWEAVYRRMDAP